MPFRKRAFLPLLLLALAAPRAHAQTRPPAPKPAAPPPQQLVVRVELPSVVGAVAKFAGGLFSKKEKERLPELKTAVDEDRTSNPVLVLRLPVPRFLNPDKPAPPTRKKDPK